MSGMGYQRPGNEIYEWIWLMEAWDNGRGRWTEALNIHGSNKVGRWVHRSRRKWKGSGCLHITPKDIWFIVVNQLTQPL